MTNTSFTAQDWQKRIYIDGFAGKHSSISVNLRRLEKKARKKISKEAFAYLAGGAGLESTIQSNRSGFEQWSIVPRVLTDVTERDTSIELFGKRIPSPILLAPIGVLELAHEHADLAVAKAAAAHGLPYIFSNQASRPMETCVSVMGESPRWFQLYWSKSRELISSFVHRAESCGCEAIVVTLDTKYLGWRVRDLDLGYLPFLKGMGIAQYTSDPVFQKMIDEPDDQPPAKKSISIKSIRGLISMVNNYPGSNFFSKLVSGRPIKAVQKFVNTYTNPQLQWSDLQYLRDQTRLPILLKGILHSDDARKAVDFGLDGIIVSNHGGRQVDGAISTIEALPNVVEAVQNKFPVIVDSGIRGGGDMFKALALGAKAVCVGRPYAYGLAVGGERGVYDVLQNFKADFELTMALSGCKNVSEINASMLTKMK